MQDHIDFNDLARSLLMQAEQLLSQWLPGGKRDGHEWVCGNLRGDPGRSLSINMSTGQWSDFSDATNELQGGDLTSLYAKIKGIGNVDAARSLITQLGLASVTRPASARPMAEVAKVKRPIGTPPPAAAGPVFTKGGWGEPSGVWAYRDTDGAIIGYVSRYEPKREGERKQYLPWTWSDEDAAWRNWQFNDPRPTYGLELLKARPTSPIMFVEGEKTADAGRRIAGAHYIVNSWPGGAKADGKVDWTPYAGRTVLLWPDADEPGVSCMHRIAARLTMLKCDVKIIDITGQPEGWDLADAERSGWDWSALRDWAKPRAQVYEAPKPEPVKPAPPPPVVADHTPAPVNETVMSNFAIHTQLGLAMDAGGNPITNLDNALRVLERWEPFRALVWYDEFHNKLFTKWGGGAAREWTDHDEMKLTVAFQRDLGIRRLKTETVHQAAVTYAKMNTRNEPKEWLESLEWDGTDRLASFFATCFGADDTEYTRAASKNWWLSMVARVMQPGCKVDNMVVLEGRQGKFKSTALAEIGGKWYTEVNESVTSKDFYLAFQGKLVVEIAELDAFGRAEVTRIKQVITCRVDRFRAPYERATADWPRRCVFVGTTNEDSYLRDATGGRRFWPVKCAAINLDEIREQREQLFAEAASLFKDGVHWWEMPSESTAREQETRRQADAWEEIISNYVRDEKEVTTQDILQQCLDIEPNRQDRAQQMRVSGVMRALGWVHQVGWAHGRTNRVWRRDA